MLIGAKAFEALIGVSDQDRQPSRSAAQLRREFRQALAEAGYGTPDQVVELVREVKRELIAAPAARSGDTVKEPPRRVFLDTNVFIVGAAFEHSPEAAILDWAGFASPREAAVVTLVSDALFRQISRVAQRLRDKDWGGEIIGRIWRNMTVDYILLDEDEIRRWEGTGAVRARMSPSI